ncbi:unnamed protein product, partial [marine sediment metagenome]
MKDRIEELETQKGVLVLLELHALVIFATQDEKINAGEFGLYLDYIETQFSQLFSQPEPRELTPLQAREKCLGRIVGSSQPETDEALREKIAEVGQEWRGL